MHILLIPSWYSTRQNPTRGRFFYAQAQALKNAGHQVGMLVPPSRLRTWHGLQEVRQHWYRRNTHITVSEDNEITIYRIPWWGFLPSLIPSQRGELALSVFERYVEAQGRPDILHGHSILYGGYLAAYIGQAQAIASVVTEHSSAYRRHLVQPGQAAFIRYTTRHANRLLAVSSSLARTIQPFSEGRTIDVVGNVADTNFFVRSPTPPPMQPFVMTIVGRLDANKSQDLLLRAFAARFRDSKTSPEHCRRWSRTKGLREPEPSALD